MRKGSNLLKWFYPGMRIKRWIAVAILGVIMLSMGFVIIISEEKGKAGLGTSILVIIGIIILITGVKRVINSLITIFLPHTEKELVDIVYKKRQLEKGPRIVAIGAGAGLPILLHGLKEFTNNITAIVTVVDEGLISSGDGDQFGAPQPYDVRDCLIALADAEPIVGRLFNYRFKKGTELWGHNFGDLFLAAMSDIMGDFDKAVKESSRVLAVRGRVVPSTLSKVSLIARHEDGTETVGRQDILNSLSPIKDVYLRPQLAKATEEALSAILRAEAIVIGPGSLYTGLMPGLLVKGIKEAFSTSRAIKIYVSNIMTEAGETDNYKVSDNLLVINRHLGANMINYCIVNKDAPSEEQLENYEQQGASLVAVDKDRISLGQCRVVEDSIIDKTGPLIRHDPLKLASIIIALVNESKKIKTYARQ